MSLKTKGVKKILDQNNTVFDLVLCANFGNDIFCFFSLFDIMVNNKVGNVITLSDTIFTYDQELNVKLEETKSSIKEEDLDKFKKNNFLVLKKNLDFNPLKSKQKYRFINKKKKLSNLFKLTYSNLKLLFEKDFGRYENFINGVDYHNFSDSNLLNFFNLYDKEICNEAMEKINKNFINDEILIMRVISDKKFTDTRLLDEKKSFIINMKNKNNIEMFIDPYDLKKLYKFTSFNVNIDENKWFRVYGLPRVSERKLLVKILNIKTGINDFSSGNICYDIQKLKIKNNKNDFSDNEYEVDENNELSKMRKRTSDNFSPNDMGMFSTTYGLYQNTVYDNFGQIKYINNEVFSNYSRDSNKRCINKNLRINDVIIGVFKNGIYIDEDLTGIENKKLEEIKYFKKNISSNLGLDKWKKINYPRNTGLYLVRRLLDYEPEEKTDEFYNLCFLGTLAGNGNSEYLYDALLSELKNFFINTNKEIKSGDLKIFMETKEKKKRYYSLFRFLEKRYGNINSNDLLFVKKFFLENYEYFKDNNDGILVKTKDEKFLGTTYLYEISLFILSDELDFSKFIIRDPNIFNNHEQRYFEIDYRGNLQFVRNDNGYFISYTTKGVSRWNEQSMDPENIEREREKRKRKLKDIIRALR